MKWVQIRVGAMGMKHEQSPDEAVYALASVPETKKKAEIPNDKPVKKRAKKS